MVPSDNAQDTTARLTLRRPRMLAGATLGVIRCMGVDLYQPKDRRAQGAIRTIFPTSQSKGSGMIIGINGTNTNMVISLCITLIWASVWFLTTRPSPHSHAATLGKLAALIALLFLAVVLLCHRLRLRVGYCRPICIAFDFSLDSVIFCHSSNIFCISFQCHSTCVNCGS